jgi:phosphatidylinositol kinase/protein kinase (PI-3  family)
MNFLKINLENYIFIHFRNSGIFFNFFFKVIPQIIARMDSPKRMVRRLIFDLLVAVGKVHPQALVYPLSGMLDRRRGGREERVV